MRKQIIKKLGGVLAADTDDAALGTGDDITFNGRKVGRIGTIVDDCDFGPIALGLVKRSALDAGTLEVGDTAASIDPSSIPEDEGPKAGREAVNRLRGR